MAKHIMQFRYYGSGNRNNNQPTNISIDNLYSGSIFGNYAPFTQLGIQTLPGTRFYLNDADHQRPIVVGSTGIYELELDGISQITTLSFDRASLQLIDESQTAYLIIDVIYNKED